MARPAFLKTLTEREMIITASFGEPASMTATGRVFISTTNEYAVPADDALYIVVSMGESSSLIGRIDLQTDATKIETTIYRDPVFFGGGAMLIYNTNDNLNPDIPIDTGALAQQPLVTDVGTQALPTFYRYGVESGGNRSVAMEIGTGLPLIGRPNTDYLIEFKNTGVASASFAASINLIESGDIL